MVLILLEKKYYCGEGLMRHSHLEGSVLLSSA